MKSLFKLGMAITVLGIALFSISPANGSTESLSKIGTPVSNIHPYHTEVYRDPD